MDPQVSTSFIPKKTLVPARTRGSLFGLIFFLVVLIFIASLTAAGGVFAYERYLKSAIEEKSNSLQLARAAYDPGVIEGLIRLDARINEASKVLNAHIAPSTLFILLESHTLERVQLTSFEYAIGDEGTASIQLQGVAESFSTLALQSDQFGGSQVMRNVIFSNITIEPVSGNVTFSVSADMDPTFLLYSRQLTSVPVLPPAVEDVVPTTPATTSEEISQ